MGGTEIFAQGLLIVTYLNVSGKISHKYIYIVQARIRDITLGGGGTFWRGVWEAPGN